MTDLSQSYWPTGDVYPLLPQYDDYKTVKSITADPTDESDRYLDIVTSLGTYWSLTLTFTDLGTDLIDAADDTVPPGYDHMSSRIWKDYGFAPEQSFTCSQVLDDTSVWQGDIKVALPVATQKMLGVNVVYNYEVDLWLTDPSASGTYQVKGLIGTLVVRR